MMKKKLMMVAIATMMMTGMAYADDRLALSGQMRVQGYSIDNYTNLDSDNDADKQAWFAQRFRLGAKLTVMEGVTANLRFDFDDDKWGSPNYDKHRYNDVSEIEIDRAYLDVNMANYQFSAGHLLQGLGNAIAVDQNTTGLTFKLKTPVSVSLMYAKFNENGGYTDKGATNDKDFYGVNVGYEKENLSCNAFIATTNDKKANDDDMPIVIGLQGKTEISGIKLNAEFNQFMGDNAANKDYMGSQLFVDANTIIGGAKVGGLVLLALGTDDTTGEEQLTELSDFASFKPLSFGILDYTDWSPVEDGYGRSSFEALGVNAGIMAISGYAEVKVIEKLTLRAQLTFAMPQEEDVTAIDSAIMLNTGLDYELLKGLSFQLSSQYTMVDVENGGDDDAPYGLFSGVRLNF